VSVASTVNGFDSAPASAPTWSLPFAIATADGSAGTPVSLKVYDKFVPLIVAQTVLTPGAVPNVRTLLAIPASDSL